MSGVTMRLLGRRATRVLAQSEESSQRCYEHTLTHRARADIPPVLLETRTAAVVAAAHAFRDSLQPLVNVAALLPSNGNQKASPELVNAIIDACDLVETCRARFEWQFGRLYGLPDLD